MTRYVVIDVSVGDAGLAARPAVFDTAGQRQIKVYRRTEREQALAHADRLNTARVIAEGREETDPCEAGTPGCSIDHGRDTGDGCETW